MSSFAGSGASLPRIAMFTALTAVCAQVALPLPLTDVPFTLQVLAVFLSGLLLGPKGGFWSQVAYLALGAAGAPVFARMSGGYGVLLGFTGGFLWAYPPAAWLAGWLSRRLAPRGLRFWPALLAALPALLVIYAGGVTGWQLYHNTGTSEALVAAALPFIPFDAAKAVLAAGIAVRVRAALRAQPGLSGFGA